MNIRKRSIAILSAMLAIVIFSSLVMASGHGNLIFHHGNNSDPYAFGSEESDRTEKSMKVLINVYFNDGTQGYSRSAENVNRSYCEVLSDYLGGHSGSSVCNYYVNGDHVHTSTAPFPFSYRCFICGRSA